MRCVDTIHLCVLPSGEDQTAPELVSLEWLEDVAGAGGLLVVELTVDEPLAQDPEVSLGTAADAPKMRTDAEASTPAEGRYRLSRRIDGTEPEGIVPTAVFLIDVGGNATTLSGGDVTLDFGLPTVDPLAWQAPPGKLALTHGDTLDYAGHVDEAPADAAVRLITTAGATVAIGEAPLFAPGVDGFDVSGSLTLPASGLESGFVELEVVVTDLAGNASAPGLSRSGLIALDVDPPTNPSLLLPGAPLTQQATISVEASAAGATAVSFAGDIVDAPAWRPLEDAPFSVTLTPGAGDKNVSAVFRDGAWNESAVAIEGIAFDPTVDLAGPRLTGATTTGGTTIVATFDEPVSGGGVTGSYSVVSTGDDTPLAVTDAQPTPDGRVVVLTTELQAAGEPYRLTVSGLTDASANQNPIDPAYDEAVLVGYGYTDTSAPLILAPLDGATVASASASVRLVWSDRFGAASYTVEIFRDVPPAMPEGAPIVVSTPFADVTTLEAGHTYYWRVRADVTTPLSYSAPRSFALLDGVIYTSCPAAESCDLGGNGTLEAPFEVIDEALGAAAARLALAWEVRVAARGGGTPYVETLNVPLGVTLKGGYSADFSERDLALHRTVLSSPSLTTLQIQSARPETPVTVDGLEIESTCPDDTYTLFVSDCDVGLTIVDTTVTAPSGTPTSTALYMIASGDSLGGGPTFVRTTLRGGDDTSKSRGAFLHDSAPVFIDSLIEGGDVTGFYPTSEGIHADGRFSLIGTTVRPGTSTGGYGSTALEAGGAEVYIGRSLIHGVNQLGSPWSSHIGRGDIEGSVIMSGTCSCSGPGWGWPALIVDGGPTRITNSTLVAGAPGAFSPHSVLVAGQDLTLTNSILVHAGGFSIACAIVGGFESVQNNLFLGCPTLISIGGTNHTSEAVLTDEAVLTGGVEGSATGNLGPSSVADLAAADFADPAGGDYSLGDDTPTAITQGGKAVGPLVSTCGADLEQPCGGLLEDWDEAARPGADGFFSIGAFEP